MEPWGHMHLGLADDHDTLSEGVRHNLMYFCYVRCYYHGGLLPASGSGLSVENGLPPGPEEVRSLDAHHAYLSITNTCVLSSSLCLEQAREMLLMSLQRILQGIRRKILIGESFIRFRNLNAGAWAHAIAQV